MCTPGWAQRCVVVVRYNVGLQHISRSLRRQRWLLLAIMSNVHFCIIPLPLPSRWTTSSTEAVHQLRPNAQLRRNQRLGKSISGSEGQIEGLLRSSSTLDF